MTQEEKFEEAKRLYGTANADQRYVLESLFPELKESENERIRKEIIKYIKTGTYHKDWIAWLEKQAQKPDTNCLLSWSETDEKMLQSLEGIVKDYWAKAEQEKNEIKIREASNVSYFLKTIQKSPLCWIKCSDRLPNRDGTYLVVTDGRHNDVYDMARYDSIEGWHKASEIIYWMPIPQLNNKSIIEQKPDDKVEPKFREGDWVVSPNGVYWHIDKISNNRYEVTSNTGESSNWPLDTNTYHSFSIQDAKDGDVLCSGQIILLFKKWEENNNWNFVIAYAGIDISGKLQITNGSWLISNSTQPATKEQRDLLFQKMKESGYEWDGKELKKIKQKPVAWSEEDERFLNVAINILNSSKVYTKSPDKYEDTINWLKSLKDRVQPQSQWRPSDEQMKALEESIMFLGTSWVSARQFALESLYQDLKRLLKI